MQCFKSSQVLKSKNNSPVKYVEAEALSDRMDYKEDF